MRRFLTSVCCVWGSSLFIAPSIAQDHPHPLHIRFDQPGSAWEGRQDNAIPAAENDNRWGNLSNRNHNGWQSSVLPLGNGSLGVTVAGGVPRARLNLNVDSLWTGDTNPQGKYNFDRNQGHYECFGSYQSLGDLVLIQTQPGEGKLHEVENYSRQLDLATAVHTTSWSRDGVDFERTSLVSHPDQVFAWQLTASKPGQIGGELGLFGAHGEFEGWEAISAENNQLILRGEFPNGLIYEARAIVLTDGGTVTTTSESLLFEDCDSAIILLAADTNYVFDAETQFLGEDPTETVLSVLQAAAGKSFQAIETAHTEDHAQLFNRVTIDLGTSDPEITAEPINQRIQRYRDEAAELPRPCLDPELEALLFQYGRYLLIGSSRAGTLPANLQGIWNPTNTPPWHADYHSNINLQMNYWLAETANLPELAQPLFDLLTSQIPIHAELTRAQYGEDRKGWVTRMSINIWGGSGWNWNIESTAWLAQHYWEHWLFNQNREFLATEAYPYLKGVTEFWLDGLKELEDGTLVVPNAWSHEHGPKEDGTAHAQQLIWDLFQNTLTAAKELNVDHQLQSRLEDLIPRLLGPQIGSWGQLMEWKEEKPDLEHSNHRHTSHLFAVHPGSQINSSTPEWLEGARVSLTERGEVGDSRRSWTWAWRTGLWARLRDADRAHGCVAGMLAHNTLDNLWTTHPPFQIDGNLGISGTMPEIFVQSQGEGVEVLPALPAAWPEGSVKGLRARGDMVIDVAWQKGGTADQEAIAVLYCSSAAPVAIATTAGDMTLISANGEEVTFAEGQQYVEITPNQDSQIQLWFR